MSVRWQVGPSVILLVRPLVKLLNFQRVFFQNVPDLRVFSALRVYFIDKSVTDSDDNGFEMFKC